MAYNEKQRRYNDQYDATHMVQYTVKYSVKIYEALEKAIEETGINRNRWTTMAITEKLERDGYLKKPENEEPENE